MPSLSTEELAAKQRLIDFIDTELRRQSIRLTRSTIEAVIDAYGVRVDKGPPY